MYLEEEEEAEAPAPVPHIAPYDRNVMYESYDAAMLDECLNDWGQDEAQRDAALEAITAEIASLDRATGDRSVQLEQLRSWATALRKFKVRHQAVANLNRAAEGHKWAPGDSIDRQPLERRTLKVEYEYKAGGEKAGRRYVKGAWFTDDVGELRCLALAGMPGDLRSKLTGAFYVDIDGVASDFFLYLNLARRAGLPPLDTKRIRAYCSTPEARKEWHCEVAKYYLHTAGRDLTHEAVEEMARHVKRWPNKLANGSGYDALMQDSSLPRIIDMNQHEKKRLLPLAKELRLLKTKLLHAECNRGFVERHTARFKHENAGREAHEVEKKVFSLLVQTEEDAILQKSVEVTRRLNRAAAGAAAFDAQPVEQRDAGALAYDGHMPKLHPAVAADVDEDGRPRLLTTIEEELAGIGVEYRLAIKPNFGLQNQPVESAVRARAALQAAVAAFPCVRSAVQGARAPPVAAAIDPGDGALSDLDDDAVEAAVAAAEAGRVGHAE